MTDVFISYAREDHKQAERLAVRLGAVGLEVWWDIDSLRLGAIFSRAIEQAVRDAQSVIVLWSVHSSTSKWVCAEADLAWNQDKLCSIIIDNHTTVPFPFHMHHALNLVGWDGSGESAVFKRLLRDLTAILTPGGRTDTSLKKSTPATGSTDTNRVQKEKASANKTEVVKPLVEDHPPGIAVPEIIPIQPGHFLMGESDHQVRIERAFGMGRYPVTYEQFDAFTLFTQVRRRTSDIGERNQAGT